MPFKFKPATRTNVPLLIGLAGGPGSGKTYSAMLLAQGLSGDKPFAVIDSESSRARFYAADFKFDHADISAPFTAGKYTEAIQAADKAGYGAIVVDSASHEYAGVGGLLEQADEELDRMAGQDWKKRDKCRMASFIKPKMEHKKFVSRLLQLRSHLILCFRAEPKIELATENGKMVVKEKQGLIGYEGWFPLTEKNLPFEMTAYFLLQAGNPGVPHPIKIMNQHKAMFPAGKEITVAAGVALAGWSGGGTPNEPKTQPEATNGNEPATPTDESLVDVIAAITDASTAEELDGLAAEIKVLSKEHREELRPIFKARLEEIKQL